MSRFVIMPCRLREDRFVPEKECSPLELDWRELAKKLAPSNRIEALKTLKHIQTGAYVGLLNQGRGRPPSNFVYIAQDRSGNAAGLIRNDPSFGSKLIEVYKVVEADRGTSFIESPKG